MSEVEQLTLFLGAEFDRHRRTREATTQGRSVFSRHIMEMSGVKLAKLEDIDSHWPDRSEPYSQAKWDDLKHKAYNQEWLEARIDKMFARDRIPFHTTTIIDVETGLPMEVEVFRHYKSAGFFRYTTAPKPTVSSGHERRKGRRICAPNTPMEIVQKSFHEWAQDNYPLHEAAYGIERHKSYLDAAVAHAGNRYFLKVDISSAYDAVDPQRLAMQLADTEATTVGPGGWFAIARRFFIPPGQSKGLATGGNASPILFNIYMRPIDEALALYAEAYGITYTRYMDDIVLSAPDTGNPDFDRIGRGKARFVKQALRAFGMEVNDHKVRYKDLQTDGPILLTGTQLDGAGNWQMPTKTVRNIAEFLDDALVKIETREEMPKHDLDELVGKIHGINSHIRHFISRRSGDPHPSEDLLRNKYEKCVDVIRERWPIKTEVKA